MRIEEYLSKPLWTRRLPNPQSKPVISTNSSMTGTMSLDDFNCEGLTQSNFADELNPTSHKINCTEYRSYRKKWKTNKETQKVEFDGWEDVVRTPFGLQMGILRHKVKHTFGNDMQFSSEGDEKDDELVAKFSSQWSISGMTDALNVWGTSAFSTGDAAIYLYIKKGQIEYKVFSYNNGDVFNMTKDENGEDLFVRLFAIDGVSLLEMYGSTNVELWVKDKHTGEGEASKVFDRVMKSLDAKMDGKKSDDGYTMIKSTPHGSKHCPVIYLREKDVCWGVGQPIMDNIDKILSDLGENNKYYAYQILFLTGGVMNLPAAEGMGKVLGSKTEKGDAKILKPADASNTFNIELEKNLDLLWETVGIINLEPKDMSGGDYSGSFIRNLYWRETQWSTNKIAEMRPALRAIVMQFKELVGIIEGDILGYDNMKMSFKLEPCIPKNTYEEIQTIQMAATAGITSIKTASGLARFNNAHEYERIQAEAKETEDAEAKKVADAADAANTNNTTETTIK